MLAGRAMTVAFAGAPAKTTARGFVVAPAILLLGTGLRQLTESMQAGVPKHWHMVFGIKFLLALHIIAVSLLTLRPSVDEAKARRLLAGAAYSSILVFLFAATMRWYTHQ